jgi:hypothetical protein
MLVLILDEDVRLAVAQEMQRVARGWVLSFDMRGMVPSRFRRSERSTSIEPLNEPELRRLFGTPVLLRRAALPIELAQRTSRSSTLTSMLASISFLQSHFLGVWRIEPDHPAG